MLPFEHRNHPSLLTVVSLAVDPNIVRTRHPAASHYHNRAIPDEGIAPARSSICYAAIRQAWWAASAIARQRPTFTRVVFAYRRTTRVAPSPVTGLPR